MVKVGSTGREMRPQQLLKVHQSNTALETLD